MYTVVDMWEVRKVQDKHSCAYQLSLMNLMAMAYVIVVVNAEWISIV